MSKVLRATTVNKDFPEGFSLDHPADLASPHLGDIVRMLWNGWNVKLTLTKENGMVVHYELVEE